MADSPAGEDGPAAGARAPTPARRYRGFCTGMVPTAIALIIALWAAVLALVWSQRREAIEEAQRDAVNLTFVFDEQVGRTLTAIDQTMRFLVADMRRAGPSFNLAEWASRAPVVEGFTTQVSIIGADGRLKASTSSPHVPPVDLSDRAHFRVHLNDDSGRLYVSAPVFGRTVKVWAIRVTRRLDGPDGAFASVLVFSLDPDYLIRLSGTPGLGSGGVISLVGLDGIVRASVGQWGAGRKSPAGRSLLGTALFDELRANPNGTLFAASPFDGMRRILAYRKVQGYPLVVPVGLGLKDVLAGSAAAAHRIFFIAAVATMVLVILFVCLFVEIERRAHREQELAVERTKLEAANRDLLASRDQAEAASQAKSEFLANTSHELRTPLNAIIGFSEIMKDQLLGPFGNPRYRKYALHIHESGCNLLALINDILDLSKAESGALEVRDEVLDVPDLVAASVGRLATEAARAGVAVELDVSGGPRTIRADEGKLRRILTNLLSNAVKFTPPGGRVVVRAAHASDGGALLAVEDTGIGMAPDEIALALGPFRQIDGRLARKFGGTGLGLPLAKRLIELQGGVMTIESARNRGTTVTLFLPQERVRSAA